MSEELDRILGAAREWTDRGSAFALATVVGVRGSTYRGLAARQLIGADGTDVGTVSGGCLDEDLRRVALEVIEEGRPRVVEFDLTADDEAVWGWGIGCNGATEVLVEPGESVIEMIDALGEHRRPLVVVHHLGGRAGERDYLVPAPPDGSFADPARSALADGRHRVVEVEGRRALLEVVGAPRRLIVCGAGHDATPLVRLALELGLHPVVVDDRRPFLTVERFGESVSLVHAAPPELGAAVDLDPSVSIVIMSHNYLRDLDYLGAAVGHGVPYIGVLGPGERLRRLLDDLRERGLELSSADLAAIHGPAGLDIGAEGPIEIAWAILAELTAVRRDRGGGFLRDRKGPDLTEYDQWPASVTEEQ